MTPSPPDREVFPFWPVELSKEEREMVSYVLDAKLTMVSPERLFSIVLSLRWIEENGIPGDVVECGVWRGGASILTGLWLQHHGIRNRKVWLYDTFSGMVASGADDVRTRDGKGYSEMLEEHEQKGMGDAGVRAFASIESVRRNFGHAGLDLSQVDFIEGDVALTLRAEENLPTDIALLRLDTDWYESTSVELEVLYPKLQLRGALLIDDYGYYDGARKAVDEYFTKVSRPFFHLDDEYGRTGLKLL